VGMTAKRFIQRSYRAVATIRQYWAYPHYNVICSGGKYKLLSYAYRVFVLGLSPSLLTFVIERYF